MGRGGPLYSNDLYIVTFILTFENSKYTRALTFENLWQSPRWEFKMAMRLLWERSRQREYLYLSLSTHTHTNTHTHAHTRTHTHTRTHKHTHTHKQVSRPFARLSEPCQRLWTRCAPALGTFCLSYRMRRYNCAWLRGNAHAPGNGHVSLHS